ncbi:carbohydrate ABC transporter substrate-binding protein (plasmid) [Rhizobium acidisoli]|uniref:Carbohydrate ABC transporter substrate-binding protein n=1 Tax=Rhizobium acidisoli TaxID=1538158 RepID=A0AAE5WST3_9HYPH|nr:ABC transporter substrate-binding protein [Rhizobium acidisoli]KPH04780.1 hypothetical protein AOG23_31215 [Rhizobium acidisoli]QAS81858.1 carbohydrate ABC transporter substrate-binding protein [Rhizobium acidisoli]
MNSSIYSNDSGLTRRRLLRNSAAVAGTFALLGGTRAIGQTRAIRFGIFGSSEKLALRGDSIKHFAETHPEIPVIYEGVPSAAWPDKIAAMIAGGNAPDVITLDSQYMPQYATRRVLEPLEAYIPEQIKADDFPPAVLDLGRTNGKLYGLPIAVSIQAMAYNGTALERLNMTLPEQFSYASFAEFCAEIHARDKSLYGSHDHGGRINDFLRVLRSQDRVLIADDKLAVTADDVGEWFNYWDGMRKSGGSVPPDIQAAYPNGEWQNAPIVLRKAVFASIQTQDLKSGFQGLTNDTLWMMAPPAWKEGVHNGCFPSPSSLLSMNARAGNKKNAAILMDYFVNSPESARILRLISGPPASMPALAAVKALPDLDRLDKNVLEYAETALKTAKAAPPVHRAQKAIEDILKRLNEDVGFERSSVKKAAKDFIGMGNAAIRRA